VLPSAPQLVSDIRQRQFIHARFHRESIDILPYAISITPSRPGSRRDHCAHSGTSLEPAIFDQCLDGFVSGIRVYLQIRSDRAHGRKRLFRSVLTAQYRPDRREHQLLYDRRSTLKREVE